MPRKYHHNFSGEFFPEQHLLARAVLSESRNQKLILCSFQEHTQKLPLKYVFNLQRVPKNRALHHLKIAFYFDFKLRILEKKVKRKDCLQCILGTSNGISSPFNNINKVPWKLCIKIFIVMCSMKKMPTRFQRQQFGVLCHFNQIYCTFVN